VLDGTTQKGGGSRPNAPRVSRWLLAAIPVLGWLVSALVRPDQREVVLVVLALVVLGAGIIPHIVGRRTAPDGSGDAAGRPLDEGRDRARASRDASSPIEPR
jgi:hypothetical protein